MSFWILTPSWGTEAGLFEVVKLSWSTAIWWGGGCVHWKTSDVFFNPGPILTYWNWSMSLRDIMNISRWWVHVTPIVIHWKLRWNHPKTEDVVTYPYHGWMTLSLTWPPHWSRKILVTSGIEWVWHLLLSDPYFGYILDRVTSSSIEPQLWKAVSHLEKSRIFFFFLKYQYSWMFLSSFFPFFPPSHYLMHVWCCWNTNG